MADPPELYFIDADSLLKCERRFDNFELFRGVWAPLEDLIAAGRLRSPTQAVDEVKRKTRMLKSWLADHPDIEVDTADLWLAAKDVMRRYEHLVKPDEVERAADPFLIALAERHRAQQGMFGGPCVVVTDETRRRNAQRITRIPEVCDDLHIVTTNLLGMFSMEGWRVALVADSPDEPLSPTSESEP